MDSEARYRDLIEGSTLGIHIANAAEQRVFVNQALADLLGYDTVDEMLVLPKFGYVALHHRDRTRSFESIDAAKGMLQNSYEIDLVKKDGSLVPVEVFWRMIDWKGEPAIQRFVIDISERKAHERALRERDKTVSELRQQLARASQIGTMSEIASVIAHELHQPLAAITNTASAAQRRLTEDSTDTSVVSKEMLPLIYNQASRAGRVIGGIRKLFNGRQTERARENINLVAAEACELASNEFTSEIMKIDLQFQDPPPFAVIDRVQIQQVIYNLLRNAVDAMRQSTAAGIILSIRTTDDEMVEISIQDEGPGMPEEVRSKLFDPFFTTKEDGMGMGLYTCRRIVESHEGNIWTDSDGIRGTIVRFTLPETGKPVTPADSPLQRDSSLH